MCQHKFFEFSTAISRITRRIKNNGPYRGGVGRGRGVGLGVAVRDGSVVGVRYRLAVLISQLGFDGGILPGSYKSIDLVGSALHRYVHGLQCL